MQARKRLELIALAGIVLMIGAMLAACGGNATSEDESDMGDMEEGGDHAMEDDDEHAMDEMEGEDEHSMDHLMIPEDAAAMENPVEATEDSISAGAETFATVCAACHGEGGMGDGPGAAGLDPAPSDLTQGDAAERTDGELFFIISNGIEDTGMPSWESQFSEEELWNLVNFIRSLQ